MLKELTVTKIAQGVFVGLFVWSIFVGAVVGIILLAAHDLGG